MSKLKNPQMQIPGGLLFYIPELKWQGRQGSSIDSLAQQAIGVLQGNPIVARKLGWDLSVPAMTARVEAFNAEVCLKMGWTDYVADEWGGSAPPKSLPPSHPSGPSALAAAGAEVRKLWSGAKTLSEWLSSGEPPVPLATAEKRASICVACPHNGQGDFTKWFTRPLSEMIVRQLAQLQERKVTTSYDDKLNICEICLCPMKLKCHVPKKFLLRHLTPDVLNSLRSVPNCWVAAVADNRSPETS